MRITRLKLVNFIGIKHGLNEDEIEINFLDNGNAFTMLIGGNGSGKSTILSQLHPFKESFDDRKELVIPGTIGIKEIDIENNGSIYNIKHIFDKKTASFIEKDGVELNPNGGVRTFEDIVATELSVTKEYYKIGKIGSNTDNFVQFSTTQRKEYISNFVAEVEKYIESFKIVSDKFKLDTEKIKMLGKELAKYEDANSIKMALSSNNAELNQIEKDILKLTESNAVTQANIDNIKESIKDFNYIAEKEKRDNLKSEKSSYETIKETLTNKYSGSDSFEEDFKNISALEESLNELTIQQAVISQELNGLKNDLVNLTNSKTSANYKLGGISVSTSSEDLKTKVKEIDETTKILEDKYNGLKIRPYLESNISTISSYLTKYEAFMQFVLANYNSLNEHSLIPDKTNIELFFTKECPSVIKQKIISIRTLIANTEKDKEDKTKDYGVKCANISKLDILAKRPKACNIDSCPFISDALKYKHLPEEIADLEKVLSDINTKLVDYSSESELIDDAKNLFKNTSTAFKTMMPGINPIYKYSSSIYGNISTIAKLPFNDLKNIYETVKKEVEDFITTYNELSFNLSEKEKLQKELETLINSESIISHFKDEIKQADEQINVVNDKIVAKQKEFDDLTNIRNDQDQYINDLKSLSAAISFLATCDKDLFKVNKKLTEYETKCGNKHDLETKLLTDKQDLTKKIQRKDALNKEIKDQEFKSQRIKEINEQVKELNKSYSNLKLVKDALDPKSGIPLIFIQAYLGKTELIANELLQLAFDGKFEIKFISGPKDFFIQVRTGDNVKNDIKLASQGEIALTTISISLALIEQSIGNFNILSLDEIDASLDSSNREAFISILNAQIHKLGIEQVFIISHNNAFDSVPMNIIALKGSDEKINNPTFMENKTVIYSKM